MINCFQTLLSNSTRAATKRWYTIKQGETVIRTPKRYNGYLGAAPTVEWLNAEIGMKAEMRPYVQVGNMYTALATSSAG